MRVDGDALASRNEFVVAHRGEREAVTRAKQTDDGEENERQQDQRDPVEDDLARRLVRCDQVGHRLGKTDARLAAEHRGLHGDEPEHFGDHPCADGEERPVQTEQQGRSWNGDDGRDDAGERDSDERMNAGQRREREGEITAEPDIGLLAERDQARVTGEQIPQARQRGVGKDFREQTECSRPPQNGAAASAANASTTSGVPIALDTLQCRTRTSLIAAPSGTDLAAAARRHDEEHDVAGEHAPAGIELRADRSARRRG